MGRGAGRDPDRGGALRGGVEQTVGQGRGAGAVTAAYQRLGEAEVETAPSVARGPRGAQQLCDASGPVVGSGPTLQNLGEVVITQSVFG